METMIAQVKTKEPVSYTTEQYEEIDRKMVKALFSFAYNGNPFFTLIGIRFRRVPTSQVDNISVHVTDKNITMFYNPDYVNNAEQSCLRYHIVHESLHLIYRHMFRFAYSQDVVDLMSHKKDVAQTSMPKLPIKASDLASDLIANRDTFTMFPDFAKYGITQADLPLKDTIRDFMGKSSEDVEKWAVDTYTSVVQPQKLMGVGSAGASGQGSKQGQDSQGNGQGNNQNQGQGDEPNKEPAPTQVGDKKVNSHAPGTQSTDDAITKRVKQGMVENMVSKAAQEAEFMSKGNIPQALKEELELINKPPRKDWKALLREYVKGSIPKSSTRTWAHINRRLPYLIKGKKPKRIPLIGVAMDTSGSVSDSQLEAFLNEINHIRKVHGSDLDIVQCDCEISDVVHVKAKDRMPTYVSGRGGTEFIPALEWFDKAKRKPDVVVFFTDLFVGDDDVPSTPRAYNIIWVGTNLPQVQHFETLGKYGKFISLDLDEEE